MESVDGETRDNICPGRVLELGVTDPKQGVCGSGQTYEETSLLCKKAVGAYLLGVFEA